MDDIFQKAIEGNSASIKQLYTSSVGSAYRSISAVCTDDGEAVQLVKEIYLWAFNSAKSYEEFFSLLNQRAAKSVKVLIDKNAALEPITASESVFADLEKMDIPDELKSYPEALCPVVIKNALQREEKTAKKPFESLKKKEKSKTELEEFEELVKKREFSAVTSSYTPPKPEEVEKPKSISEKLQNDEIILSDEQRIKQKIETQKSRKASIIAFIFAAVILVGAVVTYFITSSDKQTPSRIIRITRDNQTTEPTTAPYKDGEQKKAFEDYYNTVILNSYSVCSNQRIVAYNETKNIGIDQLNGLVSKFYIDTDADGIEEFVIIRSEIALRQNVYSYRLLLDLYRFEDLRVVQGTQNYKMVEYNIYNSSFEQISGNFKTELMLADGKQPRFIAKSVQDNLKVYSFYSFENGNIQKSESFVYISPQKNVKLYLQQTLDGTYQPLLVNVYGSNQKSVTALDEDSALRLEQFGIDFHSKEAKFTSRTAMLGYVNSLSVKQGFRFSEEFRGKSLIKDAKTICKLTAQNEQGDMLSRREVVKIEDFTGLSETKSVPQTTEKQTTKKQG